MKVNYPVLLSVMFFSCTSRPSTKEKDPMPIHRTTSKNVDTNYVRTGFYYLTEDSDGIRKKSEADGEVYSLAKTPFASVDNKTKKASDLST